MTLLATARLGLGLAAIIALLGCAASPPPDTRTADEAALRKLDYDWVKAAQTLKPAAWTAFYADDATVLAPNDTMATTKEAITKSVVDLLSLPALTISWQPRKVEVSRSGDIGYMFGTYDLTFKDTKGNPVTDHGKYLEIWKKQPDGAWKCIVDTWNTDLPS